MVEQEGITFFGKVDRDKLGKITSEYPAFYFQRQTEDLLEDIAKHERALETHSVPPSEIQYTKSELAQMKAKAKEIYESKPNLSSTQRNDVVDNYKKLGKEIGERLFTRSDMMKGTADAHVEANMMTTGCIKIDNAATHDLAMACNVSIEKRGKSHYISRNAAQKMWQIAGKYLGEPTNPEVLRRS